MYHIAQKNDKSHMVISIDEEAFDKAQTYSRQHSQLTRKEKRNILVLSPLSLGEKKNLWGKNKTKIKTKNAQQSPRANILLTKEENMMVHSLTASI